MLRSSKIVVEKLTKNVNEGHLREIFSVYGHISDMDMPLNRAFMTNRGTAYILFSSPNAAEKAIAHMHDGHIDGAQVNVSIVLPHSENHIGTEMSHHHHEEETDTGLRRGDARRSEVEEEEAEGTVLLPGRGHEVRAGEEAEHEAGVAVRRGGATPGARQGEQGMMGHLAEEDAEGVRAMEVTNRGAGAGRGKEGGE
ncbi:RNA recognition motif-containing protein 21 [Elsinoe fawcettii]|nr:RNA recognition motif-containing protein 21 [Elsinoe fawcettii]